MRGWTVSAAAGAFALALVSSCSPVTGIGDDDDDSTSDASVDDAAGPDAAWERGKVEVEVQGPDGAPAVGVRVIFNDFDGSVASTQTTDDAGRAFFDLFPQSSITVAATQSFDGSIVRHSIRTVLGVMPGDDILVTIGENDGASGGEVMGTLRIDIRTAYPDAGEYEMRIGCDSYGTSTLGTNDWTIVKDECNGGVVPVDVIAIARDSSDEPVAFQRLFSVSLSGASYTEITDWRTDWDTFTVRLNNPPDGMAAAQAEMSVWRNDLDYSLSETDPVPFTDGGDERVDLLFPPAFAERLSPSVTAFWGTFPTDINGVSLYARQGSAGDSDLRIDLSEDLLPRVTSATFEQNGAADTQMIYEVDGDPSGATVGAGSVQWSQTAADTEINWEWFFIMPPDMVSPIELPNIPPGTLAGGAWPPPEGAAITFTVVGFVDASFVGDWDDVRQNNGFELLDDPLGPDAPLGAEVRLSFGGLIGFN